MSAIFPLEGLGIDTLRPPADPNELPGLRPTTQELHLIRVDPNSSPVLRDWVGAGAANIVCKPFAPDHSAVKDPNLRRGRVVDGDVVVREFEYRAVPPGAVSRTCFRALGWFLGQEIQPRGWLNGRLL